MYVIELSTTYKPLTSALKQNPGSKNAQPAYNSRARNKLETNYD